MNSQRLAARYRSAQWKMESSAALSDKTNTMRTFIESLLLVVAAACDLNPSASVEPRSLPGIELCDALAQVCPLGEPECQDMHAACIESGGCHQQRGHGSLRAVVLPWRRR